MRLVQMEECIFCNIIDKKSKAYVVYDSSWSFSNWNCSDPNPGFGGNYCYSGKNSTQTIDITAP